MDEQPQVQKSGVNPMILGALVLIVLAAVGGFFLLNKSNSKPVSETMNMEPSPTTEPVSASPSAQPSGAMMKEENVKIFTMNTGAFYFKPDTLTVKKGDTIKLSITNDGGFHDFTLPEFNVSVKLPAGKATEVSFVASKAGKFEFYCSVMDHRAKGQKGTLVVE